MRHSSSNERSRRISGWPTYLISFVLGALSGFALVWRVGLYRIVRARVSPRGGNVLLYRALRLVFQACFSFLGPVDVFGAENVPLTGPVLILPNHQSDADPPALFVSLPRWAWFVAKDELFAIRFLGPFIRYFHAFPIRRTGGASRAALKQILELLKEQQIVVLFPEGQIAEDGVLQDFQDGAAMIALRTGVPVIPAAIDGTRSIIPCGAVLPRRSGRRVRIRFGKPVDLSDLPEGDRAASTTEATRRIRNAVVALMRE